jgi:ferredoxin
VAIGDNCKIGCPACSRVCPEGAILFPRYVDGGPISGTDGGSVDCLAGDAARRAATADMKAHITKHGHPDKPPMDQGKLDKIIDDLESFKS